jgi:hypothetical protein
LESPDSRVKGTGKERREEGRRARRGEEGRGGARRGREMEKRGGEDTVRREGEGEISSEIGGAR